MKTKLQLSGHFCTIIIGYYEFAYDIYNYKGRNVKCFLKLKQCFKDTFLN